MYKKALFWPITLLIELDDDIIKTVSEMPTVIKNSNHNKKRHLKKLTATDQSISYFSGAQLVKSNIFLSELLCSLYYYDTTKYVTKQFFRLIFYKGSV